MNGEVKPFLKVNFPRAILHVDGDGFFAGCEVAKDPSLKGKPVVVGRERGLALAMTYEAKTKGVRRGMSLTEVRALCPDAIFLDMDHESYALFSERMNNILSRYTPDIERYSVDESFADITGMRLPLKMSYEEIGNDLKNTLKRELGMTFSIGIAPTKVLAKLASNFKKPDGLTMIPGKEIRRFLTPLPIEKVWGIGRQTSAYMRKLGITSVLSFAEKTEGWVTDNFSKPHHDLWCELRGQQTLALHSGAREPYKSLMRTRTFTPLRGNKNFLLAELSRHVEVVCARAREHGLSGRTVSFFLKTQGFQYQGMSMGLSRSTNIPCEIIGLINERFKDLFEPHALYRAAGVTLSELCEGSATQLDLFDVTLSIERFERVYEEVDLLNTRFGKPLVHLAGSTHLLHKKHISRDTQNREAWDRTGIPSMGMI